MSFLSTKLKPVPPDVIFKINGEFIASNNPQKLNLSIGAYTDDSGQVYVLETVKKAKEMIQKDTKDSHQYLPIIGYRDIKNVVSKLIFGQDADSHLNQFVAFQSLGGTGGFFIGANFLKEYCGKDKVVIPSKTWTSHKPIFEGMGYKVNTYRIESNPEGALAIDPILQDLETFPEDSVVVLQACCHNPCGLDPDHEGWKKIAILMKRRNLIPFLDLAYMGFGSQDMAEDAWSVRYFASLNIDFLVSVSFSKNFGLYGERIGCLMVFTQNNDAQQAISSNIEGIIRVTYSNPPSFGAKIVLKILSDQNLYDEWHKEVSSMVNRILKVRKDLYEKLKNHGIDWPQILKSKGFFFESPLIGEIVDKLKNEWNVYILPNGRINMAGLLENRVEYFADAVKAVLS